MFHRNGFVMRTAYPNGFPGDEVDICSTLRIFAAAMWQKTAPRLQKVLEFFSQYFLFPLVWFLWTAIGTGLSSLYGIFSSGTFRILTLRDGYPFTHEIRIPFLYKIGNVRPLPLLWVAVGMLTWCLISVFPLILAMRSSSVGFSLVFELVMTTFFPWGMWVILNGRLNRERLAKKTAEFAPFLAQKVEEFSRVRSAIEVLTLLRLSIAGWRKKVCIKVKVKD